MPIADRLRSLFARKARQPKEESQAPRIVRENGSLFFGSQDTNGPALSFNVLYYAVKNHGDTNAAVRYIMNGVGKAGYDFTSPDGDDPDPALVAKATALLEGGTLSFTERKKATVLHAVAVGNYYWVILRNGNGDAIGLAQIHPSTCVVVVDQYGDVKAYLQKMSGREPLVFRPEDVVHFKDVIDPEDDVYGMGRLQAVIESELEADQKAAAMNRKIMDNDMKIPFIIKLPKEISEADFNRMAMWLRSEYQSWEKAGRPLLAPGIEGIETVAQTFADMQFLELRKLTTEKVCAVLGVPKSVLGYRDSANEATAGKVDRVTVYEDTIRPLEEMLAEKINRELFPKAGLEGIRFEFNYSSSVEAGIIEESTRKDLALGVRTINELRYERALEPFDPAEYPIADQPFLVTAMGPLLLSDPTLGAVPPEVAADVQKLLALDRIDRKA